MKLWGQHTELILSRHWAGKRRMQVGTGTEHGVKGTLVFIREELEDVEMQMGKSVMGLKVLPCTTE